MHQFLERTVDRIRAKYAIRQSREAVQESRGFTPQDLRSRLILAAYDNSAYQLGAAAKTQCLPKIVPLIADHEAYRGIIYDFFRDFVETDRLPLQFALSDFYDRPTKELALRTVGLCLIETGRSDIAKNVAMSLQYLNYASVPTLRILVDPIITRNEFDFSTLRLWKTASEYWNLPTTKQLVALVDNDYITRIDKNDFIQNASGVAFTHLAGLSRMNDAILATLDRKGLGPQIRQSETIASPLRDLTPSSKS